MWMEMNCNKIGFDNHELRPNICIILIIKTFANKIKIAAGNGENKRFYNWNAFQITRRIVIICWKFQKYLRRRGLKLLIGVPE